MVAISDNAVPTSRGVVTLLASGSECRPCEQLKHFSVCEINSHHTCAHLVCISGLALHHNILLCDMFLKDWSVQITDS